MLFTAKESTAGSAVGTDLLANTFISNAGTYRQIRKAALVGSAAVADSSVDLYIGGTFIARLFNTTAGANVLAVEAKDYISIESDFLAGPLEPIRALISKAGGTNVLVVSIDVAELG